MFIEPYELSQILFWNFGTLVNFIVFHVKTECSSLLALPAEEKALQPVYVTHTRPSRLRSSLYSFHLSSLFYDVKSQDLGDHFHLLQVLANLSHLIMWRSLRTFYQRLMWEQSTSKINGTKMILTIAENGASEPYSWLFFWFLGILWL